jgi:hypothetical protein
MNEVEVRALPMSIYSHYVMLQNDPLLALLLNPASPAPEDAYHAPEKAKARRLAREQALKDRLPDYHRLIAQVANSHVDAPVLPEWVPLLFKDLSSLADTLTCYGDALHGCIIRPGKDWGAQIRYMVRHNALPWPQPPITVTTPEETAHAPASPRETRLLPNPA